MPARTRGSFPGGLVIAASEDIGLADSGALRVALDAHHALEFVGMPEGRIPLAHATVYLATSPKSNTAYAALGKAMADVENGRTLAVPPHLRTKTRKKLAAASEEGELRGLHSAGDEISFGFLLETTTFRGPRYVPQARFICLWDGGPDLLSTRRFLAATVAWKNASVRRSETGAADAQGHRAPDRRIPAGEPEGCKQLDRPDSRVVIVPQADGFDPVKDTVADLVHPNAAGAAKMAERWFEALVTVMEKPPVRYQPEIVSYKTTSKEPLTLHVFKPQGQASKPLPVIIFFFGGGWKHGTPLQFYPECAWFASRGMVAISADYRTASSHGTTAFEAVADGKSAIRWVRQHAKDLGINPSKITAAGASAGGQIAAAAGTVGTLDEASEDLAVSSRPDALALWYPVIDNGPRGYGDEKVKARYREISPLHNITGKTPPAIVFLGTKDSLVPVATVREFEARMKEAGVRCEVKLIEGAGHPVYFYQKGASPHRDRILADCEAFLKSAGMF
jgi:acetyl esterase/lipase